MPLGRAAFVLCALALQNSVHVLLISYTRQRAGPLYLVSIVVALGEALKLVINGLLLVILERRNLKGQLDALLSLTWRQLLAYAVPSLLYTIGSNVTYVGASNLPVTAYQVTNQLRIPMTAALSRVVLCKSISRVQVAAVFLLMLGAILVLLKPDASSVETFRRTNALVGIGAVLLSCLCSTSASVWFERVIKHGASAEVPPLALWSSNILLSSFALPLAWATAAIHDGAKLADEGLFLGFDRLVVLVLASHVGGGLLVSLTLKYADNVLKTFATAAALLLSCGGSYLLFGATLAPLFLSGLVLVVLSTLLYSLELPHCCVAGAERLLRTQISNRSTFAELPEVVEGADVGAIGCGARRAGRASLGVALAQDEIGDGGGEGGDGHAGHTPGGKVPIWDAEERTSLTPVIQGTGAAVLEEQWSLTSAIHAEEEGQNSFRPRCLDAWSDSASPRRANQR